MKREKRFEVNLPVVAIYKCMTIPRPGMPVLRFCKLRLKHVYYEKKNETDVLSLNRTAKYF